jgi:hypothetical protein
MKTAYKIFIIAALVFGCLVLINRCSYKKAEVVNQNTDLSDVRRLITDSIQTANNITLIACIEDVKVQEALKAERYKATAMKYKNAAEKQKVISDSLQKLIPKTDTICIKAIESKQMEIDTLNAVCDELDAEAESYSRQLFLCENQKKLIAENLNLSKTDLQIANRSIEKLMQSNKRSWFERNKMWIGIVGGSTLTGFLIK